MAERLAYLEAVVGADITNFRKGMRDVREDIGGLSGLGAGLQSVGKDMTLAITAPLVALGTGAIAASAGFDSEMHNIGAVAGITGDQLKNLGQQVLQFGETARAGPTAAAGAIYEVFSAGITDSATAMNVLKSANATAEAGQADLQATTLATMAAFNAYGGQAMSAAGQTKLLNDISNDYTRMVGVGVGTLDQFAGSMGKTIPTAVAMGVSFEELSGSMAFLTQRSLSPATAATSINAAISSMLKPSQAMKDAFQELGVASGDELVSKFGSLEGAITALYKTTGGSQTKLNDLFQSRQAIRAVQLFTENLDTYHKALVDFNNGTDGATGKAREEQLQSFSAKWDLLKSSVQGLAITVGNVLMPAVTPIIQWLTDAFNGLSNTNPALVQLGLAFLGVMAAAGPAIWTLGLLLNPITAIPIALAGIGVIAATNFNGLRDNILNAAKEAIPALGDLQAAVEGVFRDANAKPKADSWSRIEELSAKPKKTGEDFVELNTRINNYSSIPDDKGFMENLSKSITDHIPLFTAALNNIKTEALNWLNNVFLPGVDNWGGDILNHISDSINNGSIGTTVGTLLTNLFGNSIGIGIDAADLGGPHIATAFGRLVTSVGEWVTEGGIPSIQMFMGQLVAGAAEFFDTQVGAGLQWISNLFSGTEANGGNTTIYTAVSDLLKGSVTDAIDDVIPGLGTNLGNSINGWVTNISGSTSAIQTGLSDLIKSVGDWLTNDGIPTLARVIGNVGGQIASMLYSAIDQGISYFANGGAGQSASDVSKVINGVVTTSVVTPMQEGFNDAIKGTKLETSGVPDLSATFKKILDPLKTLADSVPFQTLKTGLTDVGEAIGYFWSEMKDTDFSGLAILAASLGGFVIFAGGSVLTAIGNGMHTLADGIKFFNDGISAYIKSAGKDGLKDIAAGVVDLALGLLRIPATIIDKVTGLLNSIAGFKIPSLDAIIQQIQAEVAKAATTPVAVPLTVAPIVKLPSGGFTLDLSQPGTNIQASLDNAAAMNPAIAKAISDYVLDPSHPIDSSLGVLTFKFDENTKVNPISGVDMLTGAVLSQAQAIPVTAPVSSMTYTVTSSTQGAVTGNQMTIAGVKVNLSNPEISLGSSASQRIAAGGSQGAGTNPVAEAILPSGLLATHMTTEMDAAATGVATTLANTFAAGGIVDPKLVTDNFLVPLEQTFNAYLGPKGSTIAVVLGFTTEVGTGFGNVNTSIAAIKTTAQTTMPGIISAIAGAKPGILGLLDGIKLAVDHLRDSFKNMGDAAQKALLMAGGTPGAPKVNGALAVGGPVQANGTYLVGEKGPELFKPAGSGSIIPNDALFAGSSQNNSGGNVTNNENHFNEIADLNSLLYEANRRGIRLA